MAYSHRVVSGIDIINIEDSMDLYAVPEIKKFCKSLTRSDECKIILVLQNVHFMDSSGLGMLTNLFFECQQKGIPLKLANLSSEVRRMFSLTKLENSFRLFDTEEEAISDFN